jgi:tetratricopeptide (TPR) repeat protein
MTRKLLPDIDGEPGPMPPLSAAESDAMAWAAVSSWAARPPGLDAIDDKHGPAKPLDSTAAEQLARRVTRKRRAQPWAARAAAVALSLCSALGVAFAAYRLWPEPPRPAAGISSPRSPAPEALPAAVSDTPPATPTETSREPAANALQLPDSPKPEALLARANELRAQRSWAAAERTYRQVASASTSKEQRYVAWVASAALALQHLNKAARALHAYQAALALIPGGNLDEEALFGIAECHRALANPSAELAALQRLSAAHPNGMFTAASKPRVAALEASTP